MRNLVVGIGEVLWDVLPGGKKLGGAPANFAYHVSQFGLDSCVVSAIGNDEPGKEMQNAFDSLGLPTKLEHVPYPTGSVDITIDSAGVPSYSIRKNVAWDNIPFTPQLDALAQNVSAVCFGSLAQRSSVTRETISRFLKSIPASNDSLIVFDANLRQDYYDKEVLDSSMKMCNILKINDEELVVLNSLFRFVDSEDFRSICRSILEKYDLKILILTCGTRGSYVFTSEEESFLPTPVVEVADTVGAGDSFTAAFIANILKGQDVRSAHAKAVRTSAFVCSQFGAMPVLPAELRE